MKKISVLFALLVIGVLITGGCTTVFEGSKSAGVGEDTLSRSKEVYGTEAYAPVPAPLATLAAEGDEQEVTSSSIPREQKIIKTADVRIEVLNVSASMKEVEEIARRYDGLIQTSSLYDQGQSHYTGTVTIRVPAEFFEKTLDEIIAIGKILSRSVQAEDVTEEYVDLDAQRTSLKNQLEQYNRLLSRAENVSEILNVQKEIERVQVQLDRIEGKMKYLDNRISLSTIAVSISEPVQVTTPQGYTLPGVISEGIAGFVDTVVWLFIAILTLLPLLIIGAAGYGIYRRYKKNRSG